MSARVLGVFAGLTLFLPACAPTAVVYSPPREMVVEAAVADVRAKPIACAGGYEYDPFQETQVLAGEPVLVFERKGDWVRVECPEQPEFTHNDRWQGYPGWIERRYLTVDHRRLRRVERIDRPEEELRARIVAAAERHIGTQYFWGGRSLYDSQLRTALTGVDCSGLVNWSYREVGWSIPRDAHEQFMKARRIPSPALKAGDLIFLAGRDKPDTVVHVALYAGDGDIVEAPQTGERVRRIAFARRFGVELSGVESGAVIAERIIHFGTFFEAGP